MSNLNISIDMGRVQSSVQAAIRPAVEATLAETDIQQIIRDKLNGPGPSPSMSDGLYGYVMMSGRAKSAGSLLDGMVQEGIQEIAKEYVERELREIRPDIEEAFRKMMAGSTNRLVKAFAGAVENALKEDWAFNLKVEVEHATAERDDD